MVNRTKRPASTPPYLQLYDNVFIPSSDRTLARHPPVHHDDRAVLVIPMKVLDDVDKGLRVVVVRPQSVLIRRRLNDPRAQLVIVLQRSNRDLEQNSPVHGLLRTAESHAERLRLEIFPFDRPKLRILLSIFRRVRRSRFSTMIIFEAYLVALSQHDDGLCIMVPHHLPELHYSILHRMLRYDEFAIALETCKTTSLPPLL